MSNFYVYQYIRDITSDNGLFGSPYYIGKGRGVRAYRKNPVESIPLPKDRSNIVILFSDLLEEDAFHIERELIKEYGRIDLGTGCLRNRTDGGEGGSGAIRTAEMKNRMSVLKKGTKVTEETKAKMSSSQKGKIVAPMSKETKNKISASTKGRPKPEGFSEKISRSNSLRVVTIETRAKISASLTGKNPSDETRKKMSDAQKLRREEMS